MTRARRIVIVGPTAAGKSALAMEVARLLGDAELVSVDSMQVYRRMDIGTGTPSAAERAEVPHHLIDLLEPSEESSVAWFQQEARSALADIEARGQRAVLVGGTGLYHRAVVDDLEIPPQFPDLRAELEASGESVEALHRRLVELDPLAASRCEPTNQRRIVRALEVTLGSGRPFSSYGPGLEDYPPSDDLVVGLRVDRDDLAQRISARVQAMMTAGWLDEVRALREETPPMSAVARQALGYRELLDHLDGRLGHDEAVAATVLATRKFAVRQDRWFRRDPRIVWFDRSLGDAASEAAETRSWADRIASTVDAT